MGEVTKRAGVLLLPLLLAACFAGEGGGLIPTATGPQPFPASYRSEAVAFMRSYLNDPVGVREAAIAEPVVRPVGGRPFYVACLRYTPREGDGSYKGARERAIVYIDGRLDRVADHAGEYCAGAVYAPFPELEKMTR